jgi:uncharacterized membrane protein YecN with MAPEG domain
MRFSKEPIEGLSRFFRHHRQQTKMTTLSLTIILFLAIAGAVTWYVGTHRE